MSRYSQSSLRRSYSIKLLFADGTFHRNIGSSELDEMQRRGDLQSVTTLNKRGDMLARLKPSVESRRSMKEASKPCITYRDMLANVGLTDSPHSTVELSEASINAAQMKKWAYDSRSILHPLRDRIVVASENTPRLSHLPDVEIIRVKHARHFRWSTIDGHAISHLEYDRSLCGASVLAAISFTPADEGRAIDRASLTVEKAFARGDGPRLTLAARNVNRMTSDDYRDPLFVDEVVVREISAMWNVLRPAA